MHARDFRFEVDGTTWQPTQALFHPQDEPFPGGHRFVLGLIDPALAELVAARIRQTPALPERSTTQAVFDAVHSELVFLEGYGRDACWMLNTVDRVSRASNGQIVVEGRCSPIRR